MILYTIAPYELVFPRDPAEEVGQVSPVNGGLVATRHCGGQCVVDRLISTDPRLYLDGRYAPGSPWKGR